MLLLARQVFDFKEARLFLETLLSRSELSERIVARFRKNKVYERHHFEMNEILSKTPLSADDFEKKLIPLLNVDKQPYMFDHGEVQIDGKTYPFTKTRSTLHIGGPPYFRAGDFFVVNPHAFFEAGTKKKSDLDPLLANYPYVIKLHEIDEREGWRAYSYQSSFLGPLNSIGAYYTLPYVIGVLISMQALRDKIKGAPFVDMGSRNGLFAIAALKLGAPHALAIENSPPKFDEYLQEKFRSVPDLISLNLELNGVKEKAEVHLANFADLPSVELRHAVLAYNLPYYGFPYYGRGYAPSREEAKPNFLHDLLEKFKGAHYVIASGGDEHNLRNRLLPAAELLALKVKGDVDIPNLSAGPSHTLTFERNDFASTPLSLMPFFLGNLYLKAMKKNPNGFAAKLYLTLASWSEEFVVRLLFVEGMTLLVMFLFDFPFTGRAPPAYLIASYNSAPFCPYKNLHGTFLLARFIQKAFLERKPRPVT